MTAWPGDNLWEPADTVNPQALNDALMYLKEQAANGGGGVRIKSSVRAATTANITLSGTQTIDGVSVIADDRVLVKNQTSGAQNGVYLCKAGAWVRTTDLDTDAEMKTGVTVGVREGQRGQGSVWTLTTEGAVVLNTTVLTFELLVPGHGSVEYLTAGTYNFVAPYGITQVEIEIGAGGGGGSRGGNNESGAGGGSGEYKPWAKYSLVADSSHTVTVGAGGAGSSSVSSDGSAGGSSSFGSIVSCTGGGGGQREDASGAPAGGVSGGGAYAKAGCTAYSIGESPLVWYAGCGGDCVCNGLVIGRGGGRLASTLDVTRGDFTNLPNLRSLFLDNAVGYSPTLNGVAATGNCAGGGGGKQTTSAHSGGTGAPGLVRIKW